MTNLRSVFEEYALDPSASAPLDEAAFNKLLMHCCQDDCPDDAAIARLRDDVNGAVGTVIELDGAPLDAGEAFGLICHRNNIYEHI